MQYEDHPLAASYPLLDEPELNILAEDIKAYGLRNPVVLHQGKILDGRNRYRACQLVNVIPDFKHLKEGDNPLFFVHSVNGKGRKITQSQVALAEVLSVKIWDEMPESEKTGEHQAGVANWDVSRTMVSKARKVLKEAPESVPDIQSGKTSLVLKYDEIKKSERTPQPPPNKKEMPMKPLAKIAHECGKPFAESVYEGVIVLQKKEIEKLAKKTAIEMQQCSRYIIATRCNLAAAERALSTMVTSKSTAEFMINQAIASGEKKTIFTINKFNFTVEVPES